MLLNLTHSSNIAILHCDCTNNVHNNSFEFEYAQVGHRKILSARKIETRAAKLENVWSVNEVICGVRC